MGILLNSNSSKHFLKGTLLSFIVLFALLLPSKGYSQEDQPEVQNNSETNPGDQPTEESRPLISTTPWQNSAGSTINTNPSEDLDNANENSAGAANRPPSAQRPGSTLDGPGGGDPGGNPDVPFDKNMNLAFLSAGIVFAFYIARKRLFLKQLQ